MIEKICPSCGRSEVEFIGNFCKDCYLKKHKLIEIPKTIEIIECSNCKSIKGESIENVVKSKIKPLVEGTTEFKENKIEFQTQIEGVKIKQEFPIEIKIKKRLCEKCGRIKSGYYEAIIQVRNNKAEDIINKIQMNTFITKIEEQKNGVDIYTGSTKETRKTLKKMGFRANESKKLYSMRKGKNLYRTSFIVR